MKLSEGIDSDELATHALVFMLAGVTTRWKQVIGYQFTANSYSSQDANSLISLIIQKCHAVQINVCAVISDMGPQNQAVWRLNNITAGRFSNIKNFQNFPINENESKKVFFLPDATHVYKSIRNALVQGNRFRISQEIVEKYNLPSDEISIQPIKIVAEEDKKVHLKVAPYLKECHLELNHFDKMKVQGAMAILSHDVSAAIKYYISKGKIEQKHLTTSWFLEIIHKWYNIMSARTATQSLSTYNRDEYNTTISFLKEIIKITVNMYVGENGHWKPLQAGLLLVTQGVLDLQNLFLNEKKFNYLLQSRFTQDCLENLFSNIRSRNPVPNAKEFKTALRLISVSQYFSQPKHGNSGVTEDTELVDLLETNQPEQNNIMEPNIEFQVEEGNHDINIQEKESLFYLLGSVINNVKKNQLHCNDCMSSITTNPVNAAAEIKALVEFKSYKENLLTYPDKKLFDIILAAELFFRQYSNKLVLGELKLENLCFIFSSTVANNPFPTCHNILQRITNLFFKCRVHIFLKSKSSKFQPSTSAKCSSRSIGMRVAVNNI
jgi:hypothetical protein